MEEQWKPIKGFEGKYLVSNKGTIMNCMTGNILSNGEDRYGYQTINLRSNGENKTFLVHRLVARAFIEKPNGLNEINHINECKTDNRVENLEWVTHTENMRKYCENHNKSFGKKKTPSRKNNNYLSLKVIQLTSDWKQIREWENVATIHSVLGYNNWSIIQCCQGKRRQAYGYKWCFATDIQDLPNSQN